MTQPPRYIQQDYNVRICRDYATGRFYYVPAGGSIYSINWLEQAVQWDGKGIAVVGDNVMEDCLIQSRPETCDVIEIGGFDYVILGRNPMFRWYRVMRESPEAHRLAMFHLTYWSDLMASFWQIRAFQKLNERYLQDIDWVSP